MIYSVGGALAAISAYVAAKAPPNKGNKQNFAISGGLKVSNKQL